MDGHPCYSETATLPLPSGLGSRRIDESSPPSFRPHACHCIGCCPKCGSCRTNPSHTAERCQFLQDQAKAREEFDAGRS